MHYSFLITAMIFVSTADAASAFVWPSRVEKWQRELNLAELERRRSIIREIRDVYCASLDPLVRQALLDSDRIVRHTAAEIVAQERLPMAAAVVPWFSAADVESRLVAARVLERVSDPIGEAGLFRGCRDEEPRVRRAATKALARYSGEAMTSALIVALGDADGEVRRTAVEGLARRGRSVSVGALAARVSDRDESVRASVMRAFGVFAERNSLVMA